MKEPHYFPIYLACSLAFFCGPLPAELGETHGPAPQIQNAVERGEGLVFSKPLPKGEVAGLACDTEGPSLLRKVDGTEIALDKLGKFEVRTQVKPLAEDVGRYQDEAPRYLVAPDQKTYVYEGPEGFELRKMGSGVRISGDKMSPTVAYAADYRYSPDGKFLYLVEPDEQKGLQANWMGVTAIDTETGQRKSAHVPYPQLKFGSVSDDGKLTLTGSGIHVFDFKLPAKSGALKELTLPVRLGWNVEGAAAQTGDAKWLVAAVRGSTETELDKQFYHLMSLRGEKSVKSELPASVSKDGRHRFGRVVLSGDGSLVAAETLSGEIFLVDRNSGQVIKRFSGGDEDPLPASAPALAFCDHGRTLLRVSADGIATKWNLRAALGSAPGGNSTVEDLVRKALTSDDRTEWHRVKMELADKPEIRKWLENERKQFSLPDIETFRKETMAALSDLGGAFAVREEAETKLKGFIDTYGTRYVKQVLTPAIGKFTSPGSRSRYFENGRSKPDPEVKSRLEAIQKRAEAEVAASPAALVSNTARRKFVEQLTQMVPGFAAAP